MISGKPLLVAACAMLAGGSQAWAVPFTSAETTAWGTSSTSISPVSDEDTVSSTSGIPLTVSSSSTSSAPNLWTFSALSSAQVQSALIRLSASSHASSYDTGPASFVAASAQATSTAHWADTFTIDGGALNGQMGQLVAGFNVHGTFASSYDSSVNLSAKLYQQYRSSISLTNSGGTVVTESGGQQHLVDHNGDRLLATDLPLRNPGVWTITIDFEYGTPIGVAMWGEILTHAGALACNTNPFCFYPSSEITAAADFGHTIKWDGFLSLTDAAGNPVSNYSVSSASGFDYRHAAAPVPEPSAGLLMLAGVALVWLRVRRKPAGKTCDTAALLLPRSALA